MKASLLLKNLALVSAVIIPLTFATQASAHHHRYCHKFYKDGICKKMPPVPTATCATHATNTPLPKYVCCQSAGNFKDHYKDSQGWKDQWVAGGYCSNVGGVVSYGCTNESPVYGTNSPIIANCQYTGYFGK